MKLVGRKKAHSRESSKRFNTAGISRDFGCLNQPQIHFKATNLSVQFMLNRFKNSFNK